MPVPKLRFKDRQGHDYPEWKEQPLQDLCVLQNGYAFKSTKFCANGIPVIRISNIQNGLVINDNPIYYPKISIDERFIIEKEDILLAMSGATTGKVGIYRDKQLAYLNQRVGKFIPNNQLNNIYLFQWLNTSNYLNQLKLRLIAGAQPNISAKDIESMKIFTPPLPEQEKIAVFLTSYDHMIDIQSQRVEAMRTRKKGLLQKIFSRELRFKDEQGREYPEWKEKSIESLGTFFNGLSGKTKLDFENGNEYFIPYMNAYKNAFAKTDQLQKVKIKEEEKQNRVNYGDIMFTQSSETVEEVGLSSVWLGKSHPFLNSFCFGFRLTDVKNSVPAFWGFSLRSPAVRKQIMLEGQGISRINLSPSRLKKVIVFCPSLPEQQKIADFLTAVDHQIEIEEKRLETMKTIKKGLLQQMFI